MEKIHRKKKERIEYGKIIASEIVTVNLIVWTVIYMEK